VLIHVGYHKTGTSWLQRQVFSRPDLGFVRLSTRGMRIFGPHPLHFDAEPFRAYFHPMLEAAAAQGRLPVLSEERLSGNPFSGGYDSKELAERLAALFPDAKVLIVVREQRSMILSTWFQYVKLGGTSSLEDFLLGARDPRLPGFRFEHFAYDRLVGHYQKLFGPDRVRVELFERLRGEPEDFTASVLSFAGVPLSRELPFGRVVNRSAGPLAVALRRRLNPFLRCDSLNGYSPFANPIFRLLGEGIIRLVDRTSPRGIDGRLRARWEEHVAECAASRYSESNERLAAQTGLELRPRGYA